MKKKFGDCFKNAVYYMWKHEKKGMSLIHGLVVGTGNSITGIRYAHAWVEHGNMVIDVSVDLEKPRLIRKETYYRVGNIRKGDTNIKIWSYGALRIDTDEAIKIYNSLRLATNEELAELRPQD